MSWTCPRCSKTEARASGHICLERHFPPQSGKIAWTAAPRLSPLMNAVKPEEKERARSVIEQAIRSDGYDPERCEIMWTYLYDAGWGWSGKLKEGVSA